MKTTISADGTQFAYDELGDGPPAIIREESGVGPHGPSRAPPRDHVNT